MCTKVKVITAPPSSDQQYYCLLWNDAV